MKLYNGDCLTVLKTLPDNSVDSVVTDPPGNFNFMNKPWDIEPPEGTTQWLTNVLTECLRVLKPGGHALVWSLPRLSHKTGQAMENAGFEIRDVITHHFGTGFPKNHNISAAIDKKLGAERPIVGVDEEFLRRNPVSNHKDDFRDTHGDPSWKDGANGATRTGPGTPEATKWEGFGTALKPSTEFWWLGRKELEGTAAENVLAYGTGGINIEASRIGTEERINQPAGNPNNPDKSNTYNLGMSMKTSAEARAVSGRWPTNLVLTHSESCTMVGTKKVKTSMGVRGRQEKSEMYAGGKGFANTLGEVGQEVGYGDENGEEEVEAWECVPECPVREIDEQSGMAGSGSGKQKVSSGGKSGEGSWQQGVKGGIFQPGKKCPGVRDFGDKGGASRFFYCAKASKTDRNRGGSDNKHPTVKSTPLMRYLVRMVTPPGGTVLDPFTGSGSTGVAAKEEGMDFVGIEQSPEYFETAKKRIGIQEEQDVQA